MIGFFSCSVNNPKEAGLFCCHNRWRFQLTADLLTSTYTRRRLGLVRCWQITRGAQSASIDVGTGCVKKILHNNPAAISCRSNVTLLTVPANITDTPYAGPRW